MEGKTANLVLAREVVPTLDRTMCRQSRSSPAARITRIFRQALHCGLP